VSTTKAVARLIGRYKLATGIVAVFIVALVAITVTAGSGSGASGGSGSGGSATAKPQTAAGFTVSLLGSSTKKISLSQYAGKPVILNFWASWCAPCQQETPLLAQWYKQQDGHVNLIGLDENDTTASAQKFAQSKGVTYPIGFDPQIQVANAYSVSELPQTFFLNAKHQIVLHHDGALTTAVLAKGLRLMDNSS
jgi:cytochrome c biogenesis protein CcmG, thiol:disulfide interchange protein DsbE